ncbi:uncharacterized protein TM35_000142190 [Trypanosoma theileri]|uniref:Uncharacterized protein n=1 Tax=Trypanosoma theileri TaxID=67003 RepID=A0A1X0NWT5_9TRYP|nr:uncharacterized protein TM35_000142190 [Trypanosoma theileri]ORC89008.1 hypothetical protein TM35_000142190 [Trypanosoma theileri]
MTTSKNNAATLTYTVAPHPFSYKNVFEALLSFTPPTSGGREKSKGWWSAFWDGAEQRRIKISVGNFTEKFSRQLELANSYVVVSANCSLLSEGKPVSGVVWATSHGLYFRSFALDNSKENNNNNSNERSISSSSYSHLNPGNSEELDSEDENNNKGMDVWGDDASAIREFIPFRDIVALLPSLVLPTREEAPPYVMGIPNAIVTPNAIQVFTVSPKQIFQFVYIRKVTVVPPSSSKSGREEMGSLPILRQHEYDVMKKFHSSLDALVFCVLAERLWEARLEELKIPLLRDGVNYASPH